MKLGRIFQMKETIDDPNTLKLQVYGILKPEHIPVPKERYLIDTINDTIKKNRYKRIMIDGFEGLIYSSNLLILFKRANLFGINIFLLVRNEKRIWYAEQFTGLDGIS